jgi:hypothetical protein
VLWSYMLSAAMEAQQIVVNLYRWATYVDVSNRKVKS